MSRDGRNQGSAFADPNDSNNMLRYNVQSRAFSKATNDYLKFLDVFSTDVERYCHVAAQNLLVSSEDFKSLLQTLNVESCEFFQVEVSGVSINLMDPATLDRAILLWGANPDEPTATSEEIKERAIEKIIAMLGLEAYLKENLYKLFLNLFRENLLLYQERTTGKESKPFLTNSSFATLEAGSGDDLERFMKQVETCKKFLGKKQKEIKEALSAEGKDITVYTALYLVVKIDEAKGDSDLSFPKHFKRFIKNFFSTMEGRKQLIQVVDHLRAMTEKRAVCVSLPGDYQACFSAYLLLLQVYNYLTRDPHEQLKKAGINVISHSGNDDLKNNIATQLWKIHPVNIFVEFQAGIGIHGHQTMLSLQAEYIGLKNTKILEGKQGEAFLSFFLKVLKGEGEDSTHFDFSDEDSLIMKLRELYLKVISESQDDDDLHRLIAGACGSDDEDERDTPAARPIGPAFSFSSPASRSNSPAARSTTPPPQETGLTGDYPPE